MIPVLDLDQGVSEEGFRRSEKWILSRHLCYQYIQRRTNAVLTARLPRCQRGDGSAVILAGLRLEFLGVRTFLAFGL